MYWIMERITRYTGRLAGFARGHIRWVVYLACLLVVACAKVQYVPVERIRTVVKETRDTVLQVKTEREYVERIVAPDTVAVAETTYAVATARVDKKGLRLALHNKDTIPVKTQVELVYITDSIPIIKYVEVEPKNDSWRHISSYVVIIGLIILIILRRLRR